MKKITPLQKERVKRIVAALNEYKDEFLKYGNANGSAIWKKHGIGTIKKSLLADIKYQEVNEEYAERIFDMSRSVERDREKSLSDFSLKEILDYAFSKDENIPAISGYILSKFGVGEISELYIESCKADYVSDRSHGMQEFAKHCFDKMLAKNVADGIDKESFVNGFNIGYRTASNSLNKKVNKLSEKNHEIFEKLKHSSGELNELKGGGRTGVSSTEFIAIDKHTTSKITMELPQSMMDVISKLSDMHTDRTPKNFIRFGKNVYRPECLAFIRYKLCVSVLVFGKEIGSNSFKYFPMSYVANNMESYNEAIENDNNNNLTFM